MYICLCCVWYVNEFRARGRLKCSTAATATYTFVHDVRCAYRSIKKQTKQNRERKKNNTSTMSMHYRDIYIHTYMLEEGGGFGIRRVAPEQMHMVGQQGLALLEPLHHGRDVFTQPHIHRLHVALQDHQVDFSDALFSCICTW